MFRWDLANAAAPPLERHASKKRKLATAKEEKRLRKFRAQPNSDTLIRIERALTQRLYLVSRQVLAEDQQAFAVLGSTGNVYNVTIGQTPACNCPDYGKKGNTSCKHVLFVFLRVLRVASTNPVVWQAALLKQELVEIFAAAPSVGTGPLASAAVRSTFARINGASADDCAPAGAAATIQRRPVSGPCPICFEDMIDNAAGKSAAEETVWCQATCGLSVHATCFRQWARHSKGAPTCPYCRSAWAEGCCAPSDAGASHPGPGGYLNLGELQPGTETNPAPYYPSYSGSWRPGGWRRRW